MAVRALKFVARTDVLRVARLKKDMSHAEIAGMVGCSESLYSKIENGATMVQLDRARLIAALVSTEVAMVFTPADERIKWGRDL